jgi:hypothetical protein
MIEPAGINALSENGTVFKPADLHLTNVNGMLDQVLAWSGALKTLR